MRVETSSDHPVWYQSLTPFFRARMIGTSQTAFVVFPGRPSASSIRFS